MYRAGLRGVLERDDSFVPVGEAASAADLLPLIRSQRPDLLLLHESGAPGTALDALLDIEAAGQRVPTVLIAAPLGPDETSEALRLGVVGLLPSTVDADLLVRCLRAVSAGRLWMLRDSAAPQVNVLGEHHARWDPSRPFGLTQRELAIVLAVAEGYSNREIAERFSIKEDTVKHHVSAAFDKTGTFSRVELALFALNHKLGGRGGRP